MAIKYHFFCQHLGADISVLKVDTKEQLADLFTKGLGPTTWHLLRANKDTCLWVGTPVIFWGFHKTLDEKTLTRILLMQVRGSGMTEWHWHVTQHWQPTVSQKNLSVTCKNRWEGIGILSTRGMSDTSCRNTEYHNFMPKKHCFPSNKIEIMQA